MFFFSTKIVKPISQNYLLGQSGKLDNEPIQNLGDFSWFMGLIEPFPGKSLESWVEVIQVSGNAT